jgi:hypothetical protein
MFYLTNEMHLVYIYKQEMSLVPIHILPKISI